MKKSRIKRMIITIIAVVLVFAIATTAFAESKTFSGRKVYGGSAQGIALLTRNNEDGVRFNLSSITWNGQSTFKYRGYDNDTLAICSPNIEMTQVNYPYMAFYTYKENLNTVLLKVSIASTNKSNYLTFSGTASC